MGNKDNREDENRALERVNDLTKALAFAINRIEGPLELFRFECDENKWNDEVCDRIKKGISELGFALATMVNWFNDSNN